MDEVKGLLKDDKGKPGITVKAKALTKTK